ncbi:chemotaxis protein CheA [Candidatus Bathyarchaeota archaeon A05DMB-2]|nr:chemotaxis protein CheA [Candidatus Bathyarchaeota archaeon A05DMB-2]
MQVDSNQYRQLFIEEAKEHIDTLTQSLLSLEKNNQDTELVNVLFRSAHTLKSSSGMMGYKDFQELTHKMEDIFDGLRKGNKASSNLISILLECVDALSSKLENIRNMVEEEIDVATLTAKLQKAAKASPLEEPKEKETDTLTTKKVETTVIELDETEKDAIMTAESYGEHCYFVDLKFSSDCAFKSIRSILVMSKVSELAEIIKTQPSPKDLEAFKEEKLERGFTMAITSKYSAEEIEQCIRQVCEIEEVNVVHYIPAMAQKIEVKPDEAGSTEPQEAPQVTLLKAAKETAALPTELLSSAIALDEAAVKRCLDEPSGQVTEATKMFAEVRACQTVRVKFEQLDKIMNLVGELVISKIALLQVSADNGNGEIKRIAGNIDRLTNDLHELVMQVRMVPVSQIFDRFPRMVRDLSLQKAKTIDLVMEGRDIEIDRTVLDEIGEPLIHLLRNSIDHGIETPAERTKAGKNPVGKIRLSAQRSGDNVIIEVEDDGAGIDPEKIRETAVQKGFASEAEAAKMSRNELVSMIFLPGFSTSTEVTETSGRGIGMDVVKTKIAALGGTVQFETRLGKGTKTTLKVPLTLAIIKAILVKDSGQTFTIPTSQVSEIVKAKKSDIKLLGKTDAIVVRGKVIPVVHLHKLLGLEGSNEEEFELLITYLGDEKTKLGLVVDSVLSQQDILVKPLSETLKGIRGISGATILGDGQVVLVLDVGQFINKAQTNA